ncbi:pheromone-regulated protein prm10 [Coemansia erecta]|nr:pheromone-regulated protein prm10 [Coemansia erecta]
MPISDTFSDSMEKKGIYDEETNESNADNSDRLSQGGALGRDLSRLAAGMNSELEHTSAGFPRTQRPLQIHLDVAAVEHDIEESSETHHGYNDGPGLLSHYLQLAEIEQQRSRQHNQTLRNPGHTAPPNLRLPLANMDLTRFLPYALSTPGIQSVLASPQRSLHENSVDGMADWLKHTGNLMSAGILAGSDGELTDHDPLGSRRAHILEGIERLLQHQRFLFVLAQAMMQFGAPLHHLEDNLSRIARQLRIAATFTTMPGLVLISIEDTATFTTETKIIRCPNGYDMHRLDLTDRVVRMVSKEDIRVEDGTRQLGEIMNMPPLFTWYWQLLDWGVASWSVCLLAFNGSWIDSAAAFALGLLAGGLNLLASRLKGYTNLFEVSVSIVCGFLAAALGRWVCFPAVTLSATVVLLPGLILTTGAIELASRNMHAGTIRVGYALMLAFIIAFGINLGSSIYAEIFKPDRVSGMDIAVCSPVSRWWWWLAFPVAIMSICLLINVHPRNWPACVAVAGTMFAVFWALVIYLQLQTIGTVVAAFVLGLTGNIWGKLSRHSAYAIMLPGIMVLVPGSVGVRGIMSMFSNPELGASTQLVSQMVQTSLSIMVGLFASSFVVYPHGKKMSALITV